MNDNPNNPNTPNDPYDMINPDIFEFTGYINDINQEYTEVLMTTDSEGNYRGAYTYANGERISLEDLGQVEGVPNDPLYYLYDALGTTAAITNMNADIIDNNRFAPFGEPLSPVAKNSRLTNSPWGYTGESHDIEAGLVYLRARYYEPGTGRFIQEDSYPYFGEIEEPLTRNLYIYGKGNPLKYTDPSGHFALIPYLVKAAAKGLINGVTDLLLQVAMNYYFNPTTQGSLKASFGEVNWFQVTRSAIEGFVVPWEKGNKLARAALSAAGDVLTNALNDKNYTEEKALIDFGVGFVGDLAGGALSEIIAKYGAKPVANGLKMIGFSESDIKKFTGITVDNGPSPGTVTNGVNSTIKIAGKGNTGRTIAKNLKEQLAMEEVLSNPLENAIQLTNVVMTDVRWPASQGWIKMSKNVNGVEIHYVYNTKTNVFDDFKFK
jgi:RHS repeat-associated protein